MVSGGRLKGDNENNMSVPVKALFLKADRPYNDMEEILRIAHVEASKILGVEKVKVLNLLFCNYPVGYVAVVQVSGGRRGKNQMLGEN